MLAEAEALEQAQREERERKLPKEVTGLSDGYRWARMGESADSGSAAVPLSPPAHGPVSENVFAPENNFQRQRSKSAPPVGASAQSALRRTATVLGRISIVI
jgi:hypothetical protein